MFSHRYNNRCWNWQEGVSSSQRVLECENRTESFFFLYCCIKIWVTSFCILFNLEKPEGLGCAFLCVTVALPQLLPEHWSTGKKTQNNLKERLLCFVVSHHFHPWFFFLFLVWPLVKSISRDCKPQTGSSLKNSSWHLSLGGLRSGWYPVYLFCVIIAQGWLLKAAQVLQLQGIFSANQVFLVYSGLNRWEFILEW